MIDCVIFDMDGVLVDSEKHWAIEETKYLATRIPAPHDEYHKDIVGMSISEIYAHLKSRYDFRVEIKEFLDAYDGMAVKIYQSFSNMIPGVLDLMILLKSEGYTLALASSSPRFWVSMALDRFELEQYFRVTVSATEIGCRGKPAPDIYLYTAEQVGKKPSRCLAIEDSRNGIISAKAAGMKCIGFRNGFNDEQDLSLADLVISGFRELSTDVLGSLGK